MSQYLVSRIRAAPNIQIRLRTQVIGGGGDGHLERLRLCDNSNGTVEEVATSWLFVFIGAAPRTDWLGAEVARDDKGFVLTGADLLTVDPKTGRARSGARWPFERPPFMLESSVPGVFAAGDVRLDSMKRVASAVGEGAMAVHLVHRYLATT
jgi:thioredoxin reductase (NADPH)